MSSLIKVYKRRKCITERDLPQIDPVHPPVKLARCFLHSHILLVQSFCRSKVCRRFHHLEHHCTKSNPRDVCSQNKWSTFCGKTVIKGYNSIVTRWIWHFSRQKLKWWATFFCTNKHFWLNFSATWDDFMTAKKPKNRLQKLSLVMQNNVQLFRIVHFLSKNVALIHECSLNAI